MVEFLRLGTTDGQKFAPELGYAPCRTLVQMEPKALDQVKVY